MITKSNLVKAVIMFSLLVMPVYVHGQITATASADKDIQNLKDKVATKVAELRVKNNKAISGFITDMAGNTINIRTKDDQLYEIKLDDALTKYYKVAGNGRKEIKLSDIEKGDYVIAAGVINDKSVNANFVYIDESYIVKTGKVTEANNSTYVLKVVTTDKDNYNLSIETTTKQQIVNSKTLVVERVGFSKIKEGDTIHFVVKQTGQEKNNTYSALKILIIPQEYFMQ